MALHKAELQIICADYKLELPPSATVPEIIRVLRNFLLRKRGQAPPVITRGPMITPDPEPYGGPTITRGPEPYGKSVATPQQMPPDAPPLTDSDDDIVITVEPM